MEETVRGKRNIKHKSNTNQTQIKHKSTTKYKPGMIIIQIHSSWKRKSRDFITKLVYNVTRELDNFSKFMHNLSALGLVLITAEWNDGESRTPSTIWRRARLKSLPLSRGSMVLVFFRDIFLSTKDSMVARLLRLFKVCAVIMMINHLVRWKWLAGISRQNSK